MCRGRVLIVEDEFLVAADVEAALAELGFETVGIAPDTQAALSLAAAKPDVAIVDIHLRDGPTGPAIAQRLVEDFGVPVLFVTANPNILPRASATGILGVLGKPCREEVIGAALDYILASQNGEPADPPEDLQLFSAA
ncbi:response regulator [Phenylobacterium sp. J367]|uniref:response regulator n=1 Tax=Phenylobacterium sp. J367 TaxID=2898435 RepID=UPI0021509B97|nr:response regulator [Phenylobacterium sp. J367]MCR5878914.1 response regulator [Phenylobacterium sp. J367]